MYKKKITFINDDGVEETKVFYFRLTQAEAIEFNNTWVRTNTGLNNYLRAIVESNDLGTMTKIIKELILKAYGEKCSDGRFVKQKGEYRLADFFAASDAYSKLFIELSTNAGACLEFCNGVSGGKVTQEEIDKALADLGINDKKNKDDDHTETVAKIAKKDADDNHTETVAKIAKKDADAVDASN